MPQTANRLTHFTESVIREMTRVANQYNAINLSQGFPDADPPPEVLAAGKRAMEKGPHQYAITWGSPGFREALARKQQHWMGIDLDPDTHVVVTCGSTEAMMTAMMTACNPGDKVVIFSPYYENYGADTILSGAVPIYVPLHPPRFDFDPAELRAAFEQNPKAIVLCNPSNPSGKVFTREELDTIADLAKEFDAFVITDEVYEHIVYAPHRHHYMAALPEMFERTISCSSLSKTYNMTGWRLGYVIGPEAVIAGARKVHDFLTVGAAAPLQEAAVTALDLPLSYYDRLAADYTRKRDTFLGYLDEAGLSYTRPQGAYYVMVDCSEFGVTDDNEFCRWMAKKVGVAAVPGSSFFHEPVNHLIRLHFSRSEQILAETGLRLKKLKSLVSV
ncbi:aminotransferase [Desulfosarcina ovata subsp. sediminis]|uniref:Aminotransferase n=1 Tax=Desulfosarcina ovata subsp. sediminis TaxID=885957 RepID=A0A5K7ZPC6_9BACT|nr:aminotransferase class I/II-fold pyridoxal phosphate-dependent enzyme [Desulfosarcina ovata]BBO80740.1 aminotransferase [Desulfosarcina ovata subsp. sediminis]